MTGEELLERVAVMCEVRGFRAPEPEERIEVLARVGGVVGLNDGLCIGLRRPEKEGGGDDE